MLLKKRDIEAVIGHPGRIKIHYQPVVDLFSGRLWGYEALARGEGVLAEPGRLFRSAEALGLLGELDITCFKAIMAGGYPLEGRLCVNVTAAGLLRLNAATYANPSLIIELTEYGRGVPQQLSRALDAWRENGAGIAIDDIGRDVTQLRTALYLKPDFIKIDRFLVSGCDCRAPKRLRLVQVLEICRYLGAGVIAEGIEKPCELKVLRDLGVDYGQGYLLGKPRPGWVKDCVMAGGG